MLITSYPAFGDHKLMTYSFVFADDGKKHTMFGDYDYDVVGKFADISADDERENSDNPELTKILEDIDVSPEKKKVERGW